MSVTLQVINPNFVAEGRAGPLREISDPDAFREFVEILAQFPVLVFRDQPFTDDEQIKFAERLSGRSGHVFFSRMTNLDDDKRTLKADDFRRVYYLSTRLWHTDGSCSSTPSRFSMLSAKMLPGKGGETEFADMRGAYDSLSEDMKIELNSMCAEHSRAYSRHLIGAENVDSPDETIGGVVQPLIYLDRFTGRKSLYLSSNATKIIGLPLPDGRLLLRDLIEHATERRFVYRHEWRVNDFVIWDNRVTMHRARPYDDESQIRDLRRATTPDHGMGISA
ncbi:TauD/TfdA dioxygenase family protein [Tunturiibacter gelidoferens]|uniref:Alpha-ketoglutarate-dependent 2,4-dichlorophenoxyacetate dioxygenase n=1 Tax=Tunturiibacter gelidiferens TaxID=3069689 RepID=A0ACC5P5C1_9BACT|nr:TauD/TfdA family dioxygenase [Edaphobacter lichenicola]MBB5342010.1 alpha-ketoglutarate-dependent 2,4-dichlorophenoxyacetate dioxygenase [Edaphobacter lichenicola]